MIGIATAGIGARLGLKVSLESLVRLALWLQALGLIQFVAAVIVRVEFSLSMVVYAVSAIIQCAGLVMIYMAMAKRREYPWHVLKWIYPMGAAGPFLMGVWQLLQFLRMSVLAGSPQITNISFIVLTLFNLASVILMTMLLWWPRLPEPPPSPEAIPSEES